MGDSSGDRQSVFDYKARVSQLVAPILTIGGSHDPLIPRYLQERDYGLIAASRDGSAAANILLKVEHAGHQLMSEAYDCVKKSLESFS